MKNIAAFIGIIIVTLSCSTSKNHDAQGEKNKFDTILKLENEQSVLEINLYGGAYVNFYIKGQELNPFTWKLTSEQMPANNKAGAPFAGHFLCLGRWGSPTEGEKEAGVPHNGQATNTLWKKEKTRDASMAIMSNYAPRDGMAIVRTIKYSKTEPLFIVNEKIKNTTSIFRINNVVQHVTIGPPFLDKTTQINTNATKGFLQSMSYPDPHEYEYNWPVGYIDKNKKSIDFRRSDSDSSYVTTHLYEEPIGWITASTPEKGLLIGYIWKTNEYPWLNLWHQLVDGKLWAKGLEFGTTGIGRPYQDLLAHDTRFHGVNSFESLDAGQTVSKNFACFLIQIPSDFMGVYKVEIADGNISVIENTDSKGQSRKYEVKFEGFSNE